jgi:hypothetical protein
MFYKIGPAPFAPGRQGKPRPELAPARSSCRAGAASTCATSAGRSIWGQFSETSFGRNLQTKLDEDENNFVNKIVLMPLKEKKYHSIFS